MPGPRFDPWARGSTVRDPTGALTLNAEHTTLDWEVELGVISHHGRFLRPGDVAEEGIDGLGAQRICFIEGSPSSHRRE